MSSVPKPTVLLFDIDGTLVTTGGAGRRAMERGFSSLYGSAAVLGFRFDGLTDRWIARRGLESLGVEVTSEAIDAVLEAYVSALSEEVRRVPEDRYRVHAGVREAILHARKTGAAVGLGTGNVREGARLKLERVALYAEFAFGGFGCDAEGREELIRIGAERGARELGEPLEACRVVVIGDTPRDVAAARANGAECIGVGTGAFSAAELSASGATAAFDDLSQAGALGALLGGRV
ncbi:MAG TPA: haloacid dehalogenase-like hydrolase [Polyangiaceae bacterium]